MTERTPETTPDDEHATDKAEMGARDRAQPTLTGDQANLRADDVDDEQQRDAAVDALQSDGEG